MSEPMSEVKNTEGFFNLLKVPGDLFKTVSQNSGIKVMKDFYKLRITN